MACKLMKLVCDDSDYLKYREYNGCNRDNCCKECDEFDACRMACPNAMLAEIDRRYRRKDKGGDAVGW